MGEMTLLRKTVYRRWKMGMFQELKRFNQK